MNQLPLNTNKSFDEHGMQFAWDATSLKVAEECPRKYYYKLICGYYRPEKSYHLLFGGWYATALEHFYKHIALGLDREEALEAVVLEALLATWERPDPYAGITDQNSAAKELALAEGQIGQGHPWQSPDTAKTRENLIRTIVWYVDHFNDQNIKVIKLPDGKPAVEYSFTLNVDYGYQFCGHIDRLVDFEAHPYVMDQKTTGTTLTPRFYDQFSPDMQMSMYTFAGRAIYQMPVKGVIIDAAQIAVGFTRFERGFTFRSESQLEEWYADVIELIEQTREYTAEQHFPMRTTACGNYGGCEFRQVCSRSPQVRQNFLAAEFKQGPTWDPLTRR